MMRATFVTTAFVAAFAAAAAGQTLADRVIAGDGPVRMEYAARDGVRGCGDSVRFVSRRGNDDDWENVCEPGPVRVALTVAGGRVRTIDTYIGGRWRVRDGVTDLGSVRPEAAMDFFLSVAGTARGEVAQEAVFAASIARADGIWPRLDRLVADEGADRRARRAAVFWMSEFPGDDVADALMEILEGRDADLAERAVFALSRHESDRGRERLEQLAEDEDADRRLRERAIFWLGQGGAADAGDYLRGLYRRIDDEELRERVLFAVAQGGSTGAVAWLSEIASNRGEPAELRKRAIFWLGQRHGSAAAVIDLYDRLDERELREQAVFSLAQRRDDDAVAKLIQIARDEEDAHLRRRAIFWLGRARHPDAIAFLRELIIR